MKSTNSGAAATTVAGNVIEKTGHDMSESGNSGLTDQAHKLAALAIKFNSPMIPAPGRAVIHESARIMAEMAERLETLEQKVAKYEQTEKR